MKPTEKGSQKMQNQILARLVGLGEKRETFTEREQISKAKLDDPNCTHIRQKKEIV
jgi:hypothetical protein